MEETKTEMIDKIYGNESTPELDKEEIEVSIENFVYYNE